MELVRRPVGQSKYGHYVDNCDNPAHETQGYRWQVTLAQQLVAQNACARGISMTV